MEVSECIKVTHPESGRVVSIFLTDQEVKAVMAAGIDVLLTKGLITLVLEKEQQEGPAQ